MNSSIFFLSHPPSSSLSLFPTLGLFPPFSMFSLSSCNFLSLPSPFITIKRHTSSPLQFQHQLKQKKQHILGLCTSYEVGGGYSQEELDAIDRNRKQKHGDQSINSSHYEALLKGGEQVTSVLEEMAKLVSFSLFKFLFYFLWFP